MKKTFLSLLLFFFFTIVKGQQVEKKMVIDTAIKKHGNNMLLLHKIGENYYCGLKYSWRGLQKVTVESGDTAILHRGNAHSFYYPYVTISKHKP